MGDLTGRTLNGIYNLYACIDHTGGFADVYMARDVRNNVPVAVKVLKARLAQDARFIRRFEREALLARKLKHPNIVRVLDSGEDAGSRYIVMEWVTGHTLAKMLADHGPLSVNEAARYMCQVLAGLQDAHEQGVVHRDIKPGNIMVTADGEAKLMDFGLAKDGLVVGPKPPTGVPMSVIAGTPQYMAPEQLAGDRTDARTDVFAVAISLYELLAAKPAYTGEDFEDAKRQQQTDRPKRLDELRKDVSSKVANVVERGMALKPKDRFPSADELRRMLLAAVPPMVTARAPAVMPGGQARSANAVGADASAGKPAFDVGRLLQIIELVPNDFDDDNFKKLLRKDPATLFVWLLYPLMAIFYVLLRSCQLISRRPKPSPATGSSTWNILINLFMWDLSLLFLIGGLLLVLALLSLAPEANAVVQTGFGILVPIILWLAAPVGFLAFLWGILEVWDFFRSPNKRSILRSLLGKVVIGVVGASLGILVLVGVGEILWLLRDATSVVRIATAVVLFPIGLALVVIVTALGISLMDLIGKR